MPLDIHHLYNKVDCYICGIYAQEGPYHPLDVEPAQDGYPFLIIIILVCYIRGISALEGSCFLYRLLDCYICGTCAQRKG